MSLILSLETSTNVCSVAVHNGTQLLAFAEAHSEQVHASKLAVLIQGVIKLANVSITSLAAVAISAGPGSYTGLRIGTSTAKGLCYGLGIPLLAVGTLDSMVRQVQQFSLGDRLVCPMIDARRMEVYCQLVDNINNIVEPVQAKVIDETSFKEYLTNQDIVFFGNGAEKCKTMIQHPNAIFLQQITPSAVQVGELAGKRFAQNEFENLLQFEPIYLKEFLVAKPARV